MKLKYKDTLYDSKFEKTNNDEGLGENDFWINIHFTLKNEDIDFKDDIKGMSYSELKYWNDKNLEFITGKMKHNDTVTFIRKIGELRFYPEKGLVEKRLYLFDDIDKYCSIYLNKEEIEEIYNDIKTFIAKVESE